MSKRAADIDEGPDNKKARMLQTVANTVPSLKDLVRPQIPTQLLHGPVPSLFTITTPFIIEEFYKTCPTTGLNPMRSHCPGPPPGATYPGRVLQYSYIS